jgi:prepilin-type N-terminal cleavage/methylation domain-containing protein
MRLQRTDRPGRPGFTLIELLVVIGIIVILSTLTIVTIGGVYRYIDQVRTSAEIRQLADACEAFKLKYGRYPPSRIVLSETPGGYDANSQLYLGSIFTNIDLSQPIDWNGDGTIQTAPWVLEGDECLVYFLGGPNLQGWCTDKSKPWVATPGRNREGPFYEFRTDRLVQRRPGFFVYNDRYGRPFLYFAATANQTSNNYFAHCPTSAGNFEPYWDSARSTTSPVANKFYYMADKFQIISAGEDRNYGTGGPYNRSNPSAVGPFDRDNLTNFTEGKLHTGR